MPQQSGKKQLSAKKRPMFQDSDSGSEEIEQDMNLQQKFKANEVISESEDQAEESDDLIEEYQKMLNNQSQSDDQEDDEDIGNDDSDDEDMELEDDDQDDESGDEVIHQNGSQIDPKLLKQIIEKDQPELNKILEEYIQNVDNLNNKLKPMMQRVFDKNSGIETKHGMTYLEMKYNLLSSYCQFLQFYMLLKLEGHPNINKHPVIKRLLHIKTLLEKLRPLDQKLQYQIDKSLRTAAISEVQQDIEIDPSQLLENPLNYKPNMDNLRDPVNINEEFEDDDESALGKENDEDSDEDEEEDEGKRQIYKASKLNPVYYEDKNTKKQRRDDMLSKKKMGKSEYIEQLRKEMYDEPEEVHLGGMLNKKTAFAKQMQLMEDMEQEHFKRMSFSKKELKNIRNQEKQHLQERLDQFDDLGDIDKIIGSKNRRDREEMEMDAQLENTKFQKGLKNYIKNNNKQKKGGKDFKNGNDDFSGGYQKKRDQKSFDKKQQFGNKGGNHQNGKNKKPFNKNRR
ncbi:UNKNOWN [Stylonychia lemnae]|uniref:Sas10 C-terminal domain-containing protein n=1 Tax=Stylonychia lemnae TaxID=5949 RepID=A0A078BC00_STYLE|nr:UNKNOWN [Stylonychia lemnae]|eukprot:CDW91128.1 UNKNOWN [Stylonychia lemnae]